MGAPLPEPGEGDDRHAALAEGDAPLPARERPAGLVAGFMAGEPDETERPRGRRRRGVPTLSPSERALNRKREEALPAAG